jgi:hypothetical protein
MSGPRDITAEEQKALDIARKMARIGIPVFTAEPNTVTELGFLLPTKWEQTRPNVYVLDYWRPGMALCAVGGLLCDFIDIDPRNDGDKGVKDANKAGGFPYSYGRASTPSGGTHDMVAPLGIGKTKKMGIDLQGGKPDGSSHGFVFIAPTVRPSKVTGELLPYRWLPEPDLDGLLAHRSTKRTTGSYDNTGGYFADWITKKEEGAGPPLDSQAVYTGGFYIDTRHTGTIPPGQGHDGIVAFCGYLLKKYPTISWDDYKGLCHARWQEFDQSKFTWRWSECHYQIKHCWDRFQRGTNFVTWRSTRASRPFTGHIPTATARRFDTTGLAR